MNKNALFLCTIGLVALVYRVSTPEVKSSIAGSKPMLELQASDEVPEREDEVREGETEPSGPFNGPMRHVFGAGRLAQAIYVRDNPSQPSNNQQQLLVRYAERDPVSDEMREELLPMNASGKIIAVASRFYNDFLLAIEVSPSRVLVERWIVADPEGAQTATRGIAPTGVGVPFTPDPVSFSFVGGEWIAPEDRTQGRLERRALLQVVGGLQVVSDNANIRSLTMDPDGRFFLMRIGDEIRRYGVQPDSQFDLLNTSATIPEIEHLVNLAVAQSSEYGRIYYSPVSPVPNVSGLGRMFVMSDTDNDGVFESQFVVGNPVATPDLLITGNPVSSIIDTFRIYD